MDFFMHYLDMCIAFFGSASGQSVMIAAALEFILRMIKSDKPLGILRGIAFMVRKLGQLLGVVADFMDKILPQRLN